MNYKPYRPHKNDVCFAFVMAAVFAMTVAGGAAGAFIVARDHVVADAGMRHAAGEADRLVLVARAGVRK
jgi:hypothetical protein